MPSSFPHLLKLQNASATTAIFIPYLSFLFLGIVFRYAGLSVQNSYILKAAITATFLALFWKKYNLKLKKGFTPFSIATGFVVFLLWVSLDNFYPHMGKPTWFIPNSFFSLAFRLAGSIMIAPLVEELFVRSFMIRYIVDEDWQKVKTGKFTWASFIITVLFFGFSHDRWLVGLLSGVLFNFVLYREQSVEAAVISHATANLCLSAFILITGQYGFW